MKMVISAALFIVFVLFGLVFHQRINDFLKGDVLGELLRRLSGNQNVDVGIRGDTDSGEEVLETSAPSPSSPRAGGSEFEVFLSFRGEDTRKGFTGHLHDGLEERGISTFIDCEKLEKGDKINKLLEYINRSKIFVPIFSQRFAESKWCLKEVTKSVECGKEIIPVFFGVEPCHVRNQSGPFKSAFKDHQSIKQDQEEVRKWREALRKVGNLSGFNLMKDMNGDEAKLKRAVIERVSAKLNKKPLEVAKHPIGIETRVHDVKKMLENGSNINGVLVVGIHGMGGLGKTTIAKAVYNDLAQGFNGATCFISNVRENAGQPNGLVNLQKQFVGDILKEKNTSLGDVAQGKIVIKERASRKRVLLILDDVDNIKQVDALAGGRDWFGSGSVIIITTRNEKVLLDGNVKQDEIYKPQELNEDQSRELFMLHAFNGEQPQGEYVQLSNQVVAAAGGLPLTLEVIGSLLSSIKNVKEWKDTLEKLKKIPHREVQQRLKLSYDNLEDLEKKIFLDISCFFIGKNRKNATYMWEDSGWFPNAAIQVLVQRCLVKIHVINTMYEKYEVFEMHDQIRDMARAIVDEESYGKPQQQSRLWNNQDCWDLLQRKVPRAIDAEGIRILRKDDRFNENDYVSAEWFENMPNLRYLQAENVNFQGTFPCFPTDLKWLQLERCHFDSPPADFNLENLVILDLYKTNMAPILIKQLSLRLKAFERLKVLSFLVVETKSTPDFTNMPSLVELQFLDCFALTTIDESIGKLKNLTHLRIIRCRLLLKLPGSICQLHSLETLDLQGCFGLTSLPERLGELGSLKKLDLSWTSIKKVPCSLKNLHEMLMYGCQSLSRLPDSICRLSSLEMLGLKGCSQLCSVPEGLGYMKSLKKIDLSRTSIEVIPDSIGQLTDLVELSLCNSTGLDSLPDSICQLKLLKSLDLSGCLSLCSLPERLGDLEKLEEIILDNTIIEVLPDSVGQLKSLRLLSLQGCKFLKALPISMRHLISIQQLKMSGTGLMTSENDFPHLAAVNIIELTSSSSELLGLCNQSYKALEILHLKDAIIEELPDCVGKMENLKELRLECEMLKELPNQIEGYLENLTQLVVKSMHIKALPDCIGLLKQLSRLSLKCENLKALPNSIGSLKQMRKLKLNCVNLEALPNSIGHLKKLAEFEVWSNSLEALPDSIGSLKCVWRLKLKCPNLEILPDYIGELESLEQFEVDSHRLKYLPNSIGSLTRIWFLILNCTNLEDLPNSMERLQSLGSLHLHSDNFTAPPDFIGRLENLVTFSFNSKKLKYLDAAIFESLGRLLHLSLSGCKNLEVLIAASIRQTDFARLSSLKYLDLKDCEGREYLPQLPSSLHSLDASGCTNLRKISDISNLKTLYKLCLGGCKLLEDVPGLENISSNLEELELPGPCDFTGCCHFNHDFKNKVFKEITFENLERLKISGSLVPGSAKGQQQLQFILPRLPFSWLRGARLKLGLDKVLSPICLAIIADDVTVFEKIAEVDGDKVELNLGAESIVKTGEGAHCYTMQVTMDVSQLQNVFVLLTIRSSTSLTFQAYI